MVITVFVTNVYQLAVSRVLKSLFRSQCTNIVYCKEFINDNNPFISYIGGLEGINLLSVSEKVHVTNSSRIPFKRSLILDPLVLDAVRQSDIVFLGDPYLMSQRYYVSHVKVTALIEDSPSLFSYFRYRREMPPVKRILGELLRLHPVFDATSTCYGFSVKNNCPQGRYINLLQSLAVDMVNVIRAEIRNEFQSEFDNLHQISALNDKNTILLLTQPLASDGIVESIEKQVQFYIKNIQQLQTAGFRVFCKLHPRDVANQVHYPIEPSMVFHFSSPMELFEEELRESFVGIATYSSTSFAESTKFARISLSL
jgi:hypothetical protein